MRVALCVPSGDLVHADFCLSFADLIVTSVLNGIETVLLNSRTSLITNSRYTLVKEALRREADKLLFVDSDMMFPDDALRCLLTHEKAIVGATYIRRREPHTILGYGLDDVQPGATGLVPFARLPAGMLLVDAKVFARVPEPYFNSEWRPETRDFISEDYWFCDAARAAGFEVWCDLDLSHQMGHVGTLVYTWALAPASS